MIRPGPVLSVLSVLSAIAASPLPAQQPDSSLLSLGRIYGSGEFAAKPFGPSRWLDSGEAYTTLEPAADESGTDLVRYDVEKGTRQVMVTAAQLVPKGDSVPLVVEDYAWSPDGTMLLIFTNTGRSGGSTREAITGCSTVRAGTLRKLGGPEAKPSTLMFAKFSPDGRRVGYVRENNLYVENLDTGGITALTSDGSRTLINGTFDWVYEEELMNYYADGWRWSPDGKNIAFWQLNADSVKNFDLINNTDSLYSRVIPVQYPKVGEANSAARIGIVPSAGGATRWLQIAGDPRNHYIPRMEWAASSDEVDAPAAQSAAEHRRSDAGRRADRHGPHRSHRAGQHLGGGGGRCRLARTGEELHLGQRAGRLEPCVRRIARRQVGEAGDQRRPFDVLEIEGVDTKGGWLYYIASPDNPTQRYLYRSRLNGKGKPERLSPIKEPGTHAYDRSPNFKYAIETYSRLGIPPVIRLVRLPKNDVIRTLVDNARSRPRWRVSGAARSNGSVCPRRTA